MFEKILENDQQLIRNKQIEELESLDVKIPRRKRSFLVCLALLITCAILSAILSAILGVNKEEVDYTAFNPNGEASEYACIEVTGLVDVVEETQNGQSYIYLAYEASGSPYNKGLIKVNQAVFNSDKVQALINYSYSVLNENDSSGEAPEPITFYGMTNEVTSDLSLWILNQKLLNDFPSISPGDVYLFGKLEKEVNTSLHPVAAVPFVLALILFIVVIVMFVRYNKAKNQRKFLQAALSNDYNNTPII